MITKNIKDASQLKKELPDVLSDLKERLGSSIGVKWKLTFEKETSFSLQYNMSRFFNPGDSVKVDLLPTFEAKVENNNGKYLLWSLCSDWSQDWQWHVILPIVLVFLGSGKSTIGDFSSEQLLHIPTFLFDARQPEVDVLHTRVEQTFKQIAYISVMGVAWPFWQVRTRVNVVLKTSYKITFLLSNNLHNSVAVYRLVYNRKSYQKSF